MFSFDDIIGQEPAKQRLRQEVAEGRVPHALLFCGPAGSGKMPLALAYARYLSCPNRTATDACGHCPACAKWEKLVHPDVHFVYPMVKSSKAKKEVCGDYLPEWRRMLLNSAYFGLNHWLAEMEAENGQAIIYAKESDEISRKLSLKASEGGYKITLIWMPEKLHEVCANKLLKLLEEPPERTVFLLVSEEPERILTTIQSRTQRFNLPRIEDEAIAQALQQKYGLQQSDSLSIAHLANGNFIKALETIHLNEESKLFFDLFVRLMRLSYQRKIREMKQWSEEVAALGRERQKNFLGYCQRMIRENFILNLHRPELNYMTQEEQNFSARFSPFVNERNVMGIMHELSEAQGHIEQNVNARMVFFDFSLKMIVLLKS
ncbi:MAG: DNA polymerase III subunit delta' [Bacteroides sp.]|nr:DNA polymerase III subunit delta' [Bacteroides sp.]